MRKIRKSNRRLSADLPAMILHREVRDLVTGPEGYLIVQETEELTAEAVKQLTVEIEDSSALGRLFDMDVITEAGGISRADLDQADGNVCSARRCENLCQGYAA